DSPGGRGSGSPEGSNDRSHIQLGPGARRNSAGLPSLRDAGVTRLWDRNTRMNSEEVLVLTPPEIQSLLTIDKCIVTVEHAFRLYGEGKAAAPAVFSMHTRDGGFHVKLGLLELSRPYFGAKVNG